MAELAIAETQRATLVVAPTLDLVGQWHERLTAVFGSPIGMLGGGHHQVEDITVSTYDSAAIHLGRYGNRFDPGLRRGPPPRRTRLPLVRGLVHCALPTGPHRDLDADAEREDALTEILGEIVYEKTITELSGEFADYETVRIPVSLSPQSRRNTKRLEINSSGLWPQSASRWVPRAGGRPSSDTPRSQRPDAASKAHQRSRQIAHGTESKLQVLSDLLGREHGRRTLCSLTTTRRPTR